MLMNNQRVRELAGAFADRLLAAPADTDRVRLAFETALQRRPAAEEVAAAQAVLAQAQTSWQNEGLSPGRAHREALATLCHTLFNTAEFLHVD
jgi:limonene-1,2-epoxide hydrolase